MDAAVTPRFDADGFLAEPGEWTEEMARQIADLDGFDLTERHWRVIHALRDCYSAPGALPALPHACHVAGIDGRCMEELFHGGREAWRIAGLPNPGEEARAYL